MIILLLFPKNNYKKNVIKIYKKLKKYSKMTQINLNKKMILLNNLQMIYIILISTMICNPIMLRKKKLLYKNIQLKIYNLRPNMNAENHLKKKKYQKAVKMNLKNHKKKL